MTVERGIWLGKGFVVIRRVVFAAIPVLLAGAGVWASDWPSQSGNPQRDGWAKFEKAFTKDNVGGLQLLYTYRADNQNKGLSALTAPLINGLLITYLGFKEMLVFGGSDDNVYSVDADLNRLIWKAHFNVKQQTMAPESPFCSGGLTATLAMPGSSTAAGRGFSFRRAPVKTPPLTGVRMAPPLANEAGGAPPLPSQTTPAAPKPYGTVPPKPVASIAAVTPAQKKPGLLATGFGRLGAFLAIDSNGRLHVLNTSTGGDRVAPIPFLPAGANVSSLNVSDDTIYAATSGDCGGQPNGLYAVDLSGSDPKITSFATNGAGPSGTGGTAIGRDGTVYAQIPSGHGAVVGNYSDTVLALDPKTLEVKDFFTPSSTRRESSKPARARGATPVVFEWKGRELLVASAGDGRLYLLEANSLGGPDHHTPLSKTEPIAIEDRDYAGNGFRGAFASWEDTATRTRWVYASLSGPVNASATFSSVGEKATHGSIAAFSVQERNGEPVLVPEWASRDMIAPAPVVAANGLVFALSTGESAREAKANGSTYTAAELAKLSTHAVLYALDGATGKELYSSQSLVHSFAHEGGIAIANRRLYFTTHDNAVYSFGFLDEQPQLTGK